VPDVGRHSGVHHARWQTSKRLGPAQAHRQLEDLESVEEFEGGSLAIENVERESRACAGALLLEQAARRRILVEMRPNDVMIALQLFQFIRRLRLNAV
jgi:hypothetical protein